MSKVLVALLAVVLLAGLTTQVVLASDSLTGEIRITVAPRVHCDDLVVTGNGVVETAIYNSGTRVGGWKKTTVDGDEVISRCAYKGNNIGQWRVRTGQGNFSSIVRADETKGLDHKMFFPINLKNVDFSEPMDE